MAKLVDAVNKHMKNAIEKKNPDTRYENSTGAPHYWYVVDEKTGLFSFFQAFSTL